MPNQSTAQSGQNTPKNTLSPDFTHRLGLHSDNSQIDALCLVDSVLGACARASAVLFMVSLQFDESSEHFNEEINQNALDAAINEIRDIAAVVRAFHNASTGQNDQAGAE